MKSMVHKI